MIRKWTGMWIWGTILVGTVHAQDLSWTELETTQEPPRLATGVKMSGRKLPDVPAEIEKLSEIGYADVAFVSDAKGVGLARIPVATTPWLLQAAQAGLVGCRIKPNAPQAESTPYNSTRCYLIFNPASAGKGLANSTPRALVVRSAVFPADLIVKNKKKQADWGDLPEGIFAELSVDASGAVTDVTTVDLPEAKLASAVVAAAKQWKFAPARLEGAPVSAKIRVPVLFTWPDLFNISELTKVPRAIKQGKPVYPISERKRGFNGVVSLDFVVTKTGDVREVLVYQSNNPSLNDSAVEAVREWKFEPGLVGGRPVNTRMRVPMVFELNGAGSDRYEIAKAKSSKLPPQLQNDFSPRIKNVALGVYPFEQLKKGEHAAVTVMFAVRPDGKVKFSDEKNPAMSDFDRAARAMVEEFEFVPASKDGKPNWGVLKIEVKFESDSEQVPVSDSAHRILRELRKKEPAIFQINQVEQKPQPLSRRAPIFPSGLLETEKEGRAMIEFFIDADGQVQLPHIVSATHPSFGYAAAQAASQWRFEPLTRAGKPVIVRAQVPFVFSNSGANTSAEDPSPTPKS